MTSKLPTTIQGKQPDTILGRQTWSDLFEQAGLTWDELIRDPIHQLEHIRQYDGNTDPKILIQALYQIGFHVPLELIEPHIQKLGQALHILSLYHEQEGTKYFHKVLRFLFDRSVDIQPLFSDGCDSFYPEPLGALITDDGEWYQSSHVDLFIGLKEQDTDIVDLKNKLLNLFYQFAPINLVVRNFWLQLDLKGSLPLSGSVILDKKKRLALSYDPVVDIFIEGQVVVEQASTHTYTVRVTKQSGAIVRQQFADWNTDIGIAQANSVGQVNFGLVSDDTDIAVICRLHGLTAVLTVTVLNSLYSELRELIILGPNQIIHDSSVQFNALALYANGQALPIDPVWIFVGPEGVIKQDGTFTSYPLEQTKELKISAKVWSTRGKYWISRAHTLTVLAVPNEIYPFDLSIIAPVVVTAGQTVNIQAEVTYSDNSTYFVFPRWAVQSNSVILDLANQQLTALDVAGQIEVVLHATISIGNYTLQAEKLIYVQPLIVIPVQLFILGSLTVTEKSVNKYYATAQWSDGSSTIVHPEWFVSRYTVDENGVLSTGTTDTDIAINLSAKFSANGIEVARDINVVVQKYVVSLAYISIIGPDYIYQGQTGQYTAIGFYTDESAATVSPNWVLSVNATGFASVNATGQVTLTASPTVSIIELTATYQIGPQIYTYTKQIVCVPVLNLVQSISITGPTTVYEYEDIVLECTALMADNTVQEIIPNWSVLSPDATNHPEIDADIVNIVGILRGRPIPEPSEVIVQATYFKHVAQHSVVVLPKPRTPVNTIVGGIILGPTVVQYEVPASFSHQITYEDCGDPLLVSSDWSLSVLPTIAEIDTNGYFISHSTTSRLVTITSVHENCPGQLDTRSITIQVIGINQNNDSLVIVGPDSISDNSQTQYTAEVHRENGSIDPAPSQWSVPGAPVGVNIDISGILHVNDFNDTFQIAIQAIYNDGLNQLVANKLVTVTIVNPVYGVGPIGIDNDADILQYLTQSMTSVQSGQTFNIDLPNVGDYGYFCHPAVLGTAIFTDTSNNFQGGWDGATWPDNGSVGSTTGPLALSRTVNGDTQTWHLYRTDFAGLGTRTFRVDYVL